jgi:hypothetical protein
MKKKKKNTWGSRRITSKAVCCFGKTCLVKACLGKPWEDVQVAFFGKRHGSMIVDSIRSAEREMSGNIVNGSVTPSHAHQHIHTCSSTHLYMLIKILIHSHQCTHTHSVTPSHTLINSLIHTHQRIHTCSSMHSYTLTYLTNTLIPTQ